MKKILLGLLLPLAIFAQDLSGMLFTRGDGNSDSWTNVYTFSINSDTDVVTGFKLIKKNHKKFESLSFHNGVYYAVDSIGQFYEIDSKTGDYSINNTFGKMDQNGITGITFDENNDVIYSYWSSTNSEMRNINKWDHITGISSLYHELPENVVTDGAITYEGDNKVVVSMIDNNTWASGLRRIDNGISSGDLNYQYCLYGSEYVGEGISYYSTATKNALDFYKLVGTSWTKVFNYGVLTGGLKARGLAIEPIKTEKPFLSCQDTMYFSKISEDKSGIDLFSIDRTSSPFSFIKIGDTYSDKYNGLAYNPIDNFLYATYTNKILKIDREGAVREVSVISELPATQEDGANRQHYSATFDLNGFYYLADSINRDRIYKINIKTGDIEKTIIMNNKKSFWDMAIDGKGENIYFMNKKWNGSILEKVNINTSKVTKIGSVEVGEAVTDVIYLDVTDKVYIINSNGFFNVNNVNGVRTKLSTISKYGILNDGASCPLAEIKLLPTLTILDVSFMETDSNKVHTIGYSLNKAAVPGSSFRISSYENSAVKTNDFLEVKKELVSPSGKSGVLEFTVVGDKVEEPKENLSLVISDLKNILVAESSISVTIEDNDKVSITFEAFDTDSGIIDREIKTKILNNNFTLDLVQLKSSAIFSGDNSDINETMVRIVNSSSCEDIVTKGYKNNSRFKPFSISGSGTKHTFKSEDMFLSKDSRVQFYWEDNGKPFMSCSTDNFAMRPKRFELSLESSISAGVDFNLTIKALDGKGNIITNFNELDSTYLVSVEENNTACVRSPIFIKNGDFVSGKANVRMKYNDVGVLKFKVVESIIYANVDEKDTTAMDRIISEGNIISNEIEPFSISLDSNINSSTGNDIVYYSGSEVNIMGVSLYTKVSVLSKGGTNVKNFTNGCYAKSISVEVPFEKNGFLDQNSVFSFKNVQPGNVIFDLASDKIKYSIDSTLFKNGEGNQTVKVNFERDMNNAKTPVQITFKDPSINLLNLSDKELINKKYTFVYLRLYALDKYFLGKKGNFNISYVIYGKGVDLSDFGLNLLESSENIDWYTLPMAKKVDYKRLETRTLISKSTTIAGNYSDKVSLEYIDNKNTKIIVNKVPFVDKLIIEPSFDYLTFKQFGNIKSISAKIIFDPKESSWVGSGDVGLVVDKVAYRGRYKKIDW
jgi:hypothetical protein